jgi:DMSO/TMAO reductase YedYZ molybdopterin-dependent catalytic subunit
MKKYFLILFTILFLSSLSWADELQGFPPFITPAADYYITRIGRVPKIDPETYRLEVKGLVENSRSFGLQELYAQPMKELTLTVECIGNPPNGPLLSTATWKGFLLYDFLESLGISKGAVAVRYEGKDGYFASHSLDQVKNNNVFVALYMNGDPIPPLQGFPLRILNPGYHGVKQPAWITTIEVSENR